MLIAWLQWWDPSGWGFPGVPRGDLLFMLLLAAVLGGLVGLERELSGKPAGFRTNLLICVGAALLTDISIGMAARAAAESAIADPGRIAAQIVSGIGFLGAGTIIQSRGSIIGLTTAATLWVVAAIGIAVGAQLYVEAIGATVLVLIALLFLGRLEKLLVSRKRERSISIQVDPTHEAVAAVEAIFDERDIDHRLVEVEKHGDHYRVFYELTGPPGNRQKAVRTLFESPFVHRLNTE